MQTYRIDWASVSDSEDSYSRHIPAYEDDTEQKWHSSRNTRAKCLQPSQTRSGIELHDEVFHYLSMVTCAQASGHQRTNSRNRKQRKHGLSCGKHERLRMLAIFVNYVQLYKPSE